MFAVHTKDLTKHFNSVPAVRTIDLKIEKGLVVGIIGPDGAGKTTLLRLLSGLLPPTKGSILVEGIDVVKNPQKIKEHMGYMPQQFSLYGDLNVAQNLRFYADMYQVPKTNFFKRKKELLSFSKLAPFEKRLARNLSGGMQKKLALACNLFHTPDILFLDEPTTGVDPISRRELWDILNALNNQGITVIFTTPYMDEVQKCHQVGLMYEGRFLSYSSPQTLIEDMQDEIIELTTEQDRARKILKQIPGQKNIYPFGDTLHLVFAPGEKGVEHVKQLLKQHKIPIHSLRRIEPSFEDVFFALIQEQMET